MQCISTAACVISHTTVYDVTLQLQHSR